MTDELINVLRIPSIKESFLVCNPYRKKQGPHVDTHNWPNEANLGKIRETDLLAFELCEIVN